MRRAITHLKSGDPILAEIISRVGPCRITYREPVFETLARAIVFQQLSGKAATTIFNRLTSAAGGNVTPDSIRQLSIPELRACGLSQQKMGYLRDLAEHAAQGNPAFPRLPSMSDDEVIAALTQIKGIGVWTAQMFLIFALRRPNVLPVGDLGVRSAIKRAYRTRGTKKDPLPTPAQIRRIAAAWEPYCSVASWYLWRSLELPPQSS